MQDINQPDDMAALIDIDDSSFDITQTLNIITPPDSAATTNHGIPADSR